MTQYCVCTQNICVKNPNITNSTEMIELLRIDSQEKEIGFCKFLKCAQNVSRTSCYEKDQEGPYNIVAS